MSTAVSSHSGAGPLSLMSCVRESSPPQDGVPEYEVEKNASSKKKFWNPRKWFKRKSNKVSEEVISSGDVSEPKDTLRSRSTSELSVSEEQTRRRSGTPMHPGLSVSHDSVFHSPHSGSELDLEAAQSSSSLSISHQPTQQDIRLQTELSERLRLRRTRGDTSEDDEGLPRSPCNSPTTTDGLLDKSTIKDHPTKSHSTCSDGSLLSMGSSEMDEDSFGLQSRHSSKLSLHDKRSLDQPTNESETEWGPSHSSAPLNHSAAHHKVSIRPKRTHGAPRRKRAPVSVTPLPTTPEVNEDSSMRSGTPESTRETITELYTSMSHRQKHTITDPKIKCSSLPPGLAGPGADGNKLSRSRSNAGHKSQDPFSALEEEDPVESGKKSGDGGFFGRIFPRRSAKKKKDKDKDKKEERTVVNINANNENYSININYEPFDKTTIAVDNNLAIRPNALRSGPASRQRMQPIDIPASPDLEQPSSPLQAELESHFKNKSPPKSPWQHSKKYTKEESRSKIKIAGLSSLQQRVLSLNDETDNSFKSLTNLPTDYEKPIKTITKSHSFKSATKISYEQKQHERETLKSEEVKPKEPISIFKSISLDSVKNHEEKIVESVNEAKVTISGPSHKAIVNIGGIEEEHLISKKSEVTKIQVKRESTQVTVGKPEFYNVHLNKIENPTSLILTTNQNIEEHQKDSERRFSNDNIEIVKKINSENTEVNIKMRQSDTRYISSEISTSRINSHSTEVSSNRTNNSYNTEVDSKRFNSPDNSEVSKKFDLDPSDTRSKRLNSDTSEVSKKFDSDNSEVRNKRFNSDSAEISKRHSNDSVDVGKRYNNNNTEVGTRHNNEGSEVNKKTIDSSEVSRRYIKHDSAEIGKKSNIETAGNHKRTNSASSLNCDSNEISKRFNNDGSEVSKWNYSESTEVSRKFIASESSEVGKKITSENNEVGKRFSIEVSKKTTHGDGTEVSRRYIKNDSIDISKKINNSDSSEVRKRFNSDSNESGKRFSHDSAEVSKRTPDGSEVNRRFINQESTEGSNRSKNDNSEVGRKLTHGDSGEVNRRYIKNDEVSKKFQTDSSEAGKRYKSDTTEVSKRINADGSEVSRRINADSSEVSRRINADSSEVSKRTNADSSEASKRMNADASEVSKRYINAESIEVSRKNSSEVSKRFSIDSSEVGKRVRPDGVEVSKKFSIDSSEVGKRFNSEHSEVGKRISNESLEVGKRNNNEENECAKRADFSEGVKGEDIKMSALVTVTPMNNRFYKKHDSTKKPSITSEKPMLKIKSNSFEAVEPKKLEDNSNKSSQNSLDKIETGDNVVLRRKSLLRQKTDEEPELMKVFARRSLKLKDSDSEALSQQVILMVQESEKRDLQENQSDKENFSDSSPLEERKKTFKSVENKFLKTNAQKAGKETQKPLTENQTTKDKIEINAKNFTTKAELKDFVITPKAEIKDKAEITAQKNDFVETGEVTLRKPSVNNKFSVYQRTVSLQAPKTPEAKLLKSVSVGERPKTETWFSKNQDDEEEEDGGKEEVQGDEIITEIQELKVKPKNFNQRKAEWEKRAQEALRKTVP